MRTVSASSSGLRGHTKDPLALRTPLPSNGGLMSVGYTCTTIDSVAGAVELTLT